MKIAAPYGKTNFFEISIINTTVIEKAFSPMIETIIF